MAINKASGVRLSAPKSLVSTYLLRTTPKGVHVGFISLTMTHAIETATFGAGCFWGIEAAFRHVRGVIDTSVGYMGGHMPNPSYLDVCARITGHAEVVQLTFDPTVISYQELLEVFWHIHDPTSLNRQGPDRGEQYRSVIFCHTDSQKAIAHQSRNEHQKMLEGDRQIVTDIQPASDFYPATADHQRYYEKKGTPLPTLLQAKIPSRHLSV